MRLVRNHPHMLSWVGFMTLLVLLAVAIIRVVAAA